MTKTKVFFSTALLLIWTLPAFGLDTEPIAQLRGQAVSQSVPLSPAQVQIVEKFWRSAIDALLLSQDSEEQAGLINQLVQEKGGENLSFYASSYIDTGKKHLQAAFDAIQHWDLADRRLAMERKLMVLIARLQNIGLAPFALDRLKNPDAVVRYWAVKSLADPEMIKQISSDLVDADLKSKISKAMAESAENETNLAVLRVAVDFALAINDVACRDLLLKLAEKRTRAYMDWSVTDEWFDTHLLNGIGQTIVSGQPSDDRVKLSRAFAQLYSCVIQRSLKGQEILPASSKNALITVIAEVEYTTIAKLIPGWQMNLKRALERNTGLDREAETLLGAASRPGDLSLRLNFNYGKDAEGKAIMCPATLLAAPSPVQPVAPAPVRPVAEGSVNK